MSIESIAFWISLVLSLMVFSYLLGDNILFRVAVSIFVGLAAAYTTIVTVQSVIYPAMQPFLDGTWSIFDENTRWSVFLFVATPLVFGTLLLLKPIKSLRPLTNFALAFLIAVGSAAAVVGAVSGTLIPMVTSTARLNITDNPLDLLSSIVIVIGVISSLVYFQYRAQRDSHGVIARGSVTGAIAAIGEGFIVITLGAIYGAAILTSLTILTGQLASLFG
jgi:hypothetical protein